MDKRDKILTIGEMRAGVKGATNDCRLAYLCHEFARIVGVNEFEKIEYAQLMTGKFPELREEIERAGREVYPDYPFPQGLLFKDRRGRVVHNVRGHTNMVWYNNKKLELLDRVEAKLNETA